MEPDKFGVFEIPIMQVPQLALGTPTLTKLQLSLLHSLLDAIMQKMNCQNDKIKVSEVLGHLMEECLKTCTKSPVPFFLEGMDRPTFLDELNQIQKDIDAVLPKVEKYMQPKFNKYDHPCYIHHRYNSIACILLSNELFYAPFMEDIVIDLNNYISYLDESIEDICEDIELYEFWTNQIYIFIYLLMSIEESVGPLHNIIQSYYYGFLEGMDFLQDAFDARYDNKDLVLIKTESNEMFEKIDKMLKELEFEQERLRVVAFNLSCEKCPQAEVERTPDMSVFDKPAINPKTFLKDDDPLELYRKYLQTKCNPNHFELIEGDNGTLYRKAQF